MSKRFINAGPIAVAVILVILTASTWLPTPDCSLVRRAFDACRSLRISNAPQNSREIELARIPHNKVMTDSALFTVKAQEKRTVTDINFRYWAEPASQKAYLELAQGMTYVTLGLITHPLLNGLDWPKIADGDKRLVLYQKDATFASIDEFLASKPKRSQLIADVPAATQMKLSTSSYTDIEDPSASLESASYLLTTAPAPSGDGDWSVYDREFDLSGFQPNGESFSWRIDFRKTASEAVPFALAEVHVDYRDDRLQIP